VNNTINKDKYNAQEPRTVNTINNGNITLYNVTQDYITFKNSLIIHEEIKTQRKIISVRYVDKDFPSFT
jgi:hypothetical protein